MTAALDQASNPRDAAYRIGVDVGGTFTDIVVASEDLAPLPAKSLTTPDDPSAGVFAALAEAAHALGIERSSMLKDCRLFVLGTTVATNALLELRGATVGLICTDGFRDDLAIRRGFIPRDRDFRQPFPVELVPRRRRVSVRERIDKHGDILIDLDRDSVLDAVEVFRGDGVDSVAICLFNSFLNPVHETKVEEIVRELLPEVTISRSTQILPVMGEYPRVATTVANAYIAPRTVRWLVALEQQLRQHGLRGDLYVMQNNGGVIDTGLASQRPVLLLLSGPAAGSPGAKAVAQHRADETIVLFDMGGTSTDITILSEGTPLIADEMSIGGQEVMTPAVDVHTVAAGGGAIVHLDTGGLLRVGPQSAGAVPGPVSLGRGGTEPTVTDANLVLGRLDPDSYAGGKIPLYAELAHQAFAELGRRLDRDTGGAALGAVQIAEETMARAIRVHCLQRGIDPGQSVLVSAGGAGGLHAVAVAQILGITTALVPRTASVFCAMGMLRAQLRRDFVATLYKELEPSSAADVTTALAGLKEWADAELSSHAWPGELRYDYALALQYRGQMFQIEVPVGLAVPEAGVDAIRSAFHRVHSQRYGHNHDETAVQIVRVRLSVTGAMPVSVPRADGTSAASSPLGTRSVVFSTGDSHDAALYPADSPAAGVMINGPAVLEEPGSTILLPPQSRATRDDAGNLVITLD